MEHLRLFASVGSAIASFCSAERSRKEFGAGDYRAGWYLIDDDAIELDDPVGWEPLIHGRAWSVSLTAEPACPALT